MIIAGASVANKIAVDYQDVSLYPFRTGEPLLVVECLCRPEDSCWYAQHTWQNLIGAERVNTVPAK